VPHAETEPARSRQTEACLVPTQDRPVGWYRDDTQPSGHRFWDGRQWLVGPTPAS
jgi:hypothetical protein